MTREIDEFNTHLAAAIQARAPRLLQRYGVGPDTAAALLLVAGDNPQRLTSEMRWDNRTQHYLRRRVTEGKTRREAIRCLTRYIVREIYHDLTQTKAATYLGGVTLAAMVTNHRVRV